MRSYDYGPPTPFEIMNGMLPLSLLAVMRGHPAYSGFDVDNLRVHEVSDWFGRPAGDQGTAINNVSDRAGASLTVC